MHLQTGTTQLATQSLGVSQTDSQSQPQQIGHALFQVVPRHRQIAQIQIGSRILGGGDGIHAAAQGIATFAVQRMIDHHHSNHLVH